MQEHIAKIAAYLDDYRFKKFSGGIKMAFENGTPKTLWLSTIPSPECKPIGERFNLDEMLSMATARTFFGSLFFLLEDGDIKQFGYIETHQGGELIEMLNNYKATSAAAAPRSPEKRPAILARKKT